MLGQAVHHFVESVQPANAVVGPGGWVAAVCRRDEARAVDGVVVAGGGAVWSWSLVSAGLSDRSAAVGGAGCVVAAVGAGSAR